MNIINILSKTKREVVYKIITSLFIQGLALIIPIFWSDTINYITEGLLNKSYVFVIITLILTLFYYLWSYLNQGSWFTLYNKIYLYFTDKIITKENKKKLSSGEYANIINNDIDIICNFVCNIIARVLQVLELFVIYAYFLSISFYIFLVTLFVSIIMLIVILLSGKEIKSKNKYRKDYLDEKTILINQKYIFKQKVDDKLFTSTKNYLKYNSEYNIHANKVIYIILSIIEVVQYLVVIYSIYLISLGRMEIGTILLIYSYYSKILTNFNIMGSINAEYQSYKVSLGRLNYVINSKNN